MVTEHQREAGLSWVSVKSTFSPSFLPLANYLCSYTLYISGSACLPMVAGGVGSLGAAKVWARQAAHIVVPGGLPTRLNPSKEHPFSPACCA